MIYEDFQSQFDSGGEETNGNCWRSYAGHMLAIVANEERERE